MFISSMWDVKEPTHYSKRVGHQVPGFVASFESGWVGWVRSIWTDSGCLERLYMLTSNLVQQKEL